MPTKKQEPRQIFSGSLFHENSTLETLIKIAGVLLVLLFLKVSVVEFLSTDKGLKLLTTGCIVPPSMISKVEVPKPAPIVSSPTREDEYDWQAARIAQLELAIANLILDRIGVSVLCHQ